MTLIPVILSGGSGTRLWPLSRSTYPKQLLPLVSDFSMIQETAKRLSALHVCAPIVVCNEKHRFIIAEQLSQIGIPNPSIILEPVAKNTAPAIVAAAIQAKKIDEEAIIIVLPSDHNIKDVDAFCAAVRTAADEAGGGNLVTFGITPTFPATGYGYIQAEKGQGTHTAYPIKRFVEKPDAVAAQKYVDSGEFFWNSGMFVFRASDFLSEVATFDKSIFESTSEAFEKAVIDLDFIRLEKAAFEKNPSISIDYAVMEKTLKGKVVPLNAGWSDVGSWNSLWDVLDKDENGNVIKGKAVTSNVKNSFIYSKNRMISAVGLENVVIVDTKDAVLVADRSKSEEVKKIVDKLNAEKNPIATENTVGYRPWGTYETIELGKRYRVKHIIVKPGEKLSTQMHYHRSEHWIIVSGTAKVLNGEKEFVLTENQSTYIPVGTVHFIENPGKTPLEFIEVQSGSYLEEDDIVRFQDKYGRT
ncbi:MAG: mannose-1-phosphate guanylyltransferase/mannose-6-phosphate isomerase [Treponema sp.]|nr:mannose-1-phosphate guanylyltransferase/mannose-6-phosphate isomerase [Treponema sp.]